MAGDGGIEPPTVLLERIVMPLHQSPVATYYLLLSTYAKQKPAVAGLTLFLRFLEDDVLAELGAVFLILYLALDQLLILTSPIGLAGRFILELNE